ncbi:MAG: C45 family autoproteolytic acyltransferase/hydrolase [Phycisphaerales bacterium]|nr:C45 family autoproteolytic acyltransferase/hydrolase [Phycisphaerales bacterium]
MSNLQLPTVSVSGSPSEMGESLGESLREMAQGLVALRLKNAGDYLAERRIEGGMNLYRKAGAACLKQLESWDPVGFAELSGTARGADIPLLDLYSAVNLTDIRDVSSIGSVDGSMDEGCTAFMAPGREGGPLVVGQTWDLNAGDVDFVVAVHRLPTDGPETWSVTVAGAPTLIGMNEHGLWVGTTNIKVRGARPGVGYLDIQHRVIREQDHRSAVKLVMEAPRAAAHTYWYADASGGVELECSADHVVQRPLDDTVLVQTNHCLETSHVEMEGEPPQPSSCARLARATEILAKGKLTPEHVRVMMSDRSDGALSINRIPEDGEPTTTNACTIGIPETRTFEACRGGADRGVWVTLGFDRGS